METFYKYSNIFFISVFAFAGIYFLKTTLNQVIPEGSNFTTLCRLLPALLFKIKFWLALGCYGVSLLAFIFLLQANQAGKIFTLIVSMNILLTTLGASLFLGDVIVMNQLIGILLIITGIFFLNGH